jgi:hypothetical protein
MNIFYYSFIHMCVHCLGHFSSLPPAVTLSSPPCFKAEQNSANILNSYQTVDIHFMLIHLSPLQIIIYEAQHNSLLLRFYYTFSMKCVLGTHICFAHRHQIRSFLIYHIMG